MILLTYSRLSQLAGILVHNYFNGMISSNHLRACGYTFDPDLRNWTVAGGKSNAISNDDMICFEVEKIHECEGALSLEGINPSLNLLVDK